MTTENKIQEVIDSANTLTTTVTGLVGEIRQQVTQSIESNNTQNVNLRNQLKNEVDNISKGGKRINGLYTKRIMVQGRADTYYPVILKNPKSNHTGEGIFDNIYHVTIGRHFVDPSPSAEKRAEAGMDNGYWGHLRIELEFTRNDWGGNQFYSKVKSFMNNYRVLCACIMRDTIMTHYDDRWGNDRINHNLSCVVWLRGGGSQYDLTSDYPLNDNNVVIKYDDIIPFKSQSLVQSAEYAEWIEFAHLTPITEAYRLKYRTWIDDVIAKRIDYGLSTDAINNIIQRSPAYMIHGLMHIKSQNAFDKAWVYRDYISNNGNAPLWIDGWWMEEVNTVYGSYHITNGYSDRSPGKPNGIIRTTSQLTSPAIIAENKADFPNVVYDPEYAVTKFTNALWLMQPFMRQYSPYRFPVLYDLLIDFNTGKAKPEMTAEDFNSEAVRRLARYSIENPTGA